MNRGRRRGASLAALAPVIVTAWLAPNSTESAVANGDTRTVTFSNQHTNEEGSFTYMVNGVYDQGTLDKLNWFMRDWRLNEPTKMDPHLFDIIWEVYRESGSRQPINVFSAYRSPQTNAMLRRRSRQVAEHSQHMQGKAIDAHFEDVGPGRIRDIAMRMQEGGVGFYPQGLTWVHIDSGSVRYWPRMSREALTRLFPDGKTVFIPSDGQPMPGYELAKAEIEQRGGEIQTASGGGFFAWLAGVFGGGADDAEESGGQETAMAVASSRGGRGGGAPGRTAQPAPVEIAEAGPAAVAKAKRGLPAGPAYAGPAPDAPEPQAPPAPVPPPPAPAEVASAPEPAAVAALEQPQTESDAAPEKPVKLKGPIAALYLAPLPPRRPANLELQLALLADVPLPPVRPAELSAPAPAPAASARAATSPLPPVRPAHLALLAPAAAAPPPNVAASIGAPAALPPVVAAANTPPPVRADDPEGLPSVITHGLTRPPPPVALALVELGPKPSLAVDRTALLERAAELAAPLPPMPIPDAAPAPAPQPAARAAPTEKKTGFVEKFARLFGFGAESDQGLRGSEQ